MRKSKQIDPRKDPLKYMETLPDKRRVSHCAKHVMYQPECKECIADWNEFWDIKDRWVRDHKYPSNENIQVIYHGNAEAEAKRRKEEADKSG